MDQLSLARAIMAERHEAARAHQYDALARSLRPRRRRRLHWPEWQWRRARQWEPGTQPS
jgi:hypothetical protein